METDDEDLDTHICLACQLPIIGLENYVFHKKHECSARKQKSVTARSQPSSHGNTVYTSGHDVVASHGISVTQQGHLHHTNNLQSLSQISHEQLGSLHLAQGQLEQLGSGGQLTPAVCHAMSLLTKSPPAIAAMSSTSIHSATPARYNVVDPNLVLDTMSGPISTTADDLTVSEVTDPISTMSSTLDTSTHTTSIMDFLSSLELQCRPHTSPEKLESGTTDSLHVMDDHNEPRVPEGLKLANLLNDLNFDSDSEGFDMPSDAEDLLNFTEDDYRELGVTGSSGGKGKGHGEGKGHGAIKGKGKKGKGEYQHAAVKSKKGSLPGKWRPGERVGGKLASGARWSSIGKRHYEDMSSDGEDADNTTPPDVPVLVETIETDNISQSHEPAAAEQKLLFGTSTSGAGSITIETIDSMEATAVDVLLQIKSEVREMVRDHTYDGTEAPQEGPDHTYDTTVADSGTVTLLKCEPCNRLFRNTLGLHSHMRSAAHKAVAAGLRPIKEYGVGNRNQFQVECDGCKRSFNNKYNYARHLMSALHLKRSKSSLLHLDPAFQRMLLPLKPFQCRICQFYCNNHEDLLEHMSCEDHQVKLDTLVGPQTCTRCKFCTRGPREMYEHFTSKLHSETILHSERPCVLREMRHNLQCVHCERFFHSATKLRLHCNQDHPIKIEKCKGVPRKTRCDICDKDFSSHANWVQHHRRKHAQDDSLERRCTICHTKNFADQSYLEHHYKSKRHMANVLKAAANTSPREEITPDSTIVLQRRGRGRPPGSKSKMHSPFKGDKNKIHKCKECDYSTIVYSDLRPHYISVHSKNMMYDFMCETCGVGFDTQMKLDKHFANRRHSRVEMEAKAVDHKAIVCATCGHKFYTQDRFSLHMLSHTSSQLTSVQDRKVARKLSGVPEKFHSFIMKLPTSHLKDVQCPDCKEWVRSNNMASHIRSRHGDPADLPYKCTFCPKTFPSNTSLYRHHKGHLGMKTFACKICGKGYRSKSDLDTHELNTHDRELDVVAKLQCSMCGERFMQRTRLNIHMKKKHEKTREFPCSWPGCHRQFIFRSEFVLHQRVHTGERPYLCDLCGYSTKTKVQLRRHERSHTGESNYKCKYCTYSASHSWGLRRHMRIHSGAKPYRCPHCDYRCNCHTNLRHHIITSKRHRGMCLYHCKQCGYATNTGNEFQQHCIMLHNMEPETVENVAQYCGVYLPEEDCRDVLEGCQVLPVPERKPRVKKQKLLLTEQMRAAAEDQMEVVLEEQESASHSIIDIVPESSTDLHIMRVQPTPPSIQDQDTMLLPHVIGSHHNIPSSQGDLHGNHVVVHEVTPDNQIREVILSNHEILNDNQEVITSNHEVDHGNHEILQGNHEVLHGNHEVIYTKQENQPMIQHHAVTYHSTPEVTHIPLTSDLTHLMVPHMEGMEQTGAVVELHMEGEYTLPTHQGEIIRTVGPDSKPVQFYYM